MKEVYENVRLDGLYTTRAPLSHIGESVSTTTYLVQDPVVQEDGTVAEVFTYNGGAHRGQWRDLMARRVCVAVDRQLPADAFHLLFSGGRLDQADKRADLEYARRLRATVPMLSLLGGGIGSEILQGRLKVSNSVPLCREAIPLLPRELHERAGAVSYGSIIFEKEFSRKDDAKLGWQSRYLEPSAAPRNARAVPDQMRMTNELLAAGVDLHTRIYGSHLTRVELGCLVAALHDFADEPFIGGQSNRGHGLVGLTYGLRADARDPDGLVIDDFVTVDPDHGVNLSDEARSMMRDYERYLADNIDAIQALLKVAA